MPIFLIKQRKIKSVDFKNTISGLLASLVLLLPCAGFASVHIQAFGLSDNPFSHHTGSTTVCYLESLHQMQSQIKHTFKKRLDKSFGWSSPPKNLSTAQIRQIALNPAFKNKLIQTGQAYRCRVEAKLLGIKQLPSIVFNDRFVIVGETNIEQAREEFKNSGFNHAKERSYD